MKLRLGLNTPQLAELSDRWAGYVFGRTSMAMEVGLYIAQYPILIQDIHMMCLSFTYYTYYSYYIDMIYTYF